MVGPLAFGRWHSRGGTAGEEPLVAVADPRYNVSCGFGGPWRERALKHGTSVSIGNLGDVHGVHERGTAPPVGSPDATCASVPLRPQP